MKRDYDSHVSRIIHLGGSMGAIDDALQANRSYSERFNMGHLSAPAVRQLAVVACMDARQDMFEMLGLKPGDAHIIRNAGGIVTDDVLRSLLISHYLLFTREFMIINHTGCGLLTFKDEDFRVRLQQITGTAALAPTSFHAFSDLGENVRQQVQKVKGHPWVPNHIVVRGFIYDTGTGKISEVP